MIVCSCKRVSDRTIGALAASGAATLADLARATGAGTECGRCEDDLARILAERGAPCRERPCEGCPRLAQAG